MLITDDHVAIAPPAGVPSWDVDPYEEDLLRQPEGYYAELRARGPFVYLSRYAMLACGRHAETQTVFSDSKRFVSSRGVGLREFDRRRLLGYGAMVFNALGPDNALRRAAMAQAPDIVPWITAHCRREQLRPDGMGAMIYQAVDAGELSEDEAGMLVRSLLSAGIDTTVTGIGNALWCLATNPDEFERLRADPALARPAFQEVLRYTSPVHSFCRTSVADTEVSGIAVPEDAKILCVLARAEVEAVLTALATRVTRIELDAPAEWRPGNSIRSLERLPLRISAA